MTKEKDTKALTKEDQKRKSYNPKEKILSKKFNLQFKQYQALNLISKETLLIHLPNERKSSTYQYQYTPAGEIIWDPFKDINHKKSFNWIQSKRDMLYNKGLKEMGILPGLTDYLIIKPNFITMSIIPININPPRENKLKISHFGFMEVKMKGNKLTPYQLWFRDYCYKHNIPWHLLEDYSGFEEAFDFINKI